MGLGAVIVVYNTHINESTTFNSLKNDYHGKLVIWDNSTDDIIREKNKQFSIENNIDYLTLNQNVGLSKAYNQVIDYYQDKDISHLVLFDDDTILSDEYLLALSKGNFEKKTIYAPQIYNGDVLVNPTYFNHNQLVEFFKKKKYGSLERVKELVGTNKLSAINSGLIIPFDIFTHFRYDENIFLDCVDFYFCQKAYNYGYIIDILDATISQNYSFEELDNNKDESKRLEIRLKDNKAFCPKYFFINKLIIIAVYVLNSKNFSYMKYLFKKV